MAEISLSSIFLSVVIISMENNNNPVLNDAEIALSNNHFNVALDLYREVLETEPDNLLALSRAGMVCIILEKHENAIRYFSRAIKADPENGDNYFNLGNAYFLQEKYNKAFEYFVEAKNYECSEDVRVRLYYQMALLCSLRNDIKSALTYMRMCEDADTTGTLAGSQELLSEKTKLYMALEDYDNAEKSAAQLVATAPTVFANYMVYFSLLMARRKLSTAQSTLSDAEKYSDMSDEDHSTLAMQKATVYMALGEADENLRRSSYQQAVNTLKAASAREGVTPEQKNEIRAALAEVLMKMGRLDEAIHCLEATMESSSPPPVNVTPYVRPTGAEMAETMRADVDAMSVRIRRGEIPPNLPKTVKYDERGNPVYEYQDKVLEDIARSKSADGQEPEDESAQMVETPPQMSPDFWDRVHFLLLSCMLEKDDFEQAAKWADALKSSDNDYYVCYGVYADALSQRKLMRDAEMVRKKYEETIAFFRSKSFANPSDTLPSIFRARLYAEEGSYERASEIAQLLSEEDQKTVLDYIKACQKENP